MTCGWELKTSLLAFSSFATVLCMMLPKYAHGRSDKPTKLLFRQTCLCNDVMEDYSALCPKFSQSARPGTDTTLD
jgi:hypothetical protein